MPLPSVDSYDILKENKAGYTATPVACGWAGEVIEVTRSFGQEQRPTPPPKKKLSVTNRQSDGQTDTRTD